MAITALCYGTCAPVVAGFLAGAVQTGSLKGAIIGAFSAGIFQGIGDAFKNIANANYAESMDLMTKSIADGGLGLSKSTAEMFASRGLTMTQQVGKVLSHAVAGGAMSRLNGGKFGNGFLSAGVTQAFSKTINGIGDGAREFGGQRIAAAAVLGGVTSAATGGKFANGAITAAFSRAFNDEVHLPESESLADSVFGAFYRLTNGWSPDQSTVDAVAGFGDGAFKVVTFGFGNLGEIRNALGIDGGVNTSSSEYQSSFVAGAGVGLLATGGAFNVMLRPTALIHFTSSAAASSIYADGVITTAGGLYGTGVYATAFSSRIYATLQGARATEAAITFSTQGLKVAPTFFPGTFRVIGSVPL